MDLTNATNGATSAAGGVTPVTSRITSTLQNPIATLKSTTGSLLNKIVSPQAQQDIKQRLTKFATERPMLASFLLSQIALSGFPLALFLIMTFTVVIFALIAGLIVGLVGALLFILFAVIVALFILLPTLFITTFFAVAIWLWGVGGYYIVKMFNDKKVPGIHVPLKQGLMEQTGLKDLSIFSGQQQDNSSGGNAASKNGHSTAPSIKPKQSTAAHDHHDEKNQARHSDHKPKSTLTATTTGDEKVTSGHQSDDTIAQQTKTTSTSNPNREVNNSVNQASNTVGNIGSQLTA